MTKLVDLTLTAYTDEVRGEKPAPGGGSVSHRSHKWSEV